MAVFNSVSSSAALLSTQLYAPYGASRFTAGTPSTYTNKGYTGQYNDPVSGLDYYNARYYDPVSGVFLSADTVEGNDSGMNPYAYVGGNPETFTDPSGLIFGLGKFPTGWEGFSEGADTGEECIMRG
jgi:RHS repeat-associated protein